jgi:N-acetyl-anhydromuramyl-L-alanine amidase AmpD
VSWYLLDHPNPDPATRRWYPTRRSPIRLIVLHTAEVSPDWTGQDLAAEAVARYGSQTTRRVSWHSTVDSDTTIPMLPDGYTAFHVQGYNSPSLGVEIATRASAWSSAPPGWVEAVIGRLADVIRVWQIRYAIPTVRLTRGQVDAGAAGIVAHATLDPARRSDPGATFPWRLLWAHLREEEEVQQTLSEGLIDNNSVRLYQRALNAWLPVGAVGLPVSGDFDPATAAAVRSYQQAAGLEPTGIIDGLTAANLSTYIVR